MIFALTLAVGLATPSPVPAPDADSIYRTAMRQLVQLPQPPYIDVTETRVTTATTREGVTTSEDVSRNIFDSIDRRECIFSEPGDLEVVIGPSYFAPDMWLLGRRLQPVPEPSTPNLAPDLSDLKVIADVVAKSAYAVRLVDSTPTRDGATLRHLDLRPIADSRKHNLRELWIDSSNNRIVHALIEGSYRPMPGFPLEDTPVSEDFGQVGPYWLVVHRIWLYAAPFSGVKFKFEATVHTMRFPSSVPSWFFDEAAFKAHASQVPAALSALQ